MIPFFYDLRWDCPHIQMHVDFWGALKNHKWRNVHNKHQQCALLVYQGQQRHQWHDTIMLVRAFDLSLLIEELLRPTLDNILIKAQSEQLDVFNMVSHSIFKFTCLLPFAHSFLFLSLLHPFCFIGVQWLFPYTPPHTLAPHQWSPTYSMP